MVRATRGAVGVRFVDALINDRHEIVLPDFRRDFHAERPRWEKGRLDSCAERIEDGMVVYDIGAEHGDFTALYKLWAGPTGDVIPIEPAPHYWPFIRKTWEANGFRSPPELAFPGFIGDVVGDLAGWSYYGWPQCSEGEGIPDGGFRHLAQDQATARTTIDWVASYAPPDVIVMDIEGAEYHALSGAGGILAVRDVLVYVSVHEPTMAAWYRKTLDELHRLMGGYGYTGALLPHNGEGETFWLYEARR